MEPSYYPGPDVLLARLTQDQDISPPAGGPPTEEFLRDLAERLGLRSHDLFLVAGMPLPEDALDFDAAAGRRVSLLVQYALPLSAPDRERLRESARAMAAAPRPDQPIEPPRQRHYPPGFGPLLVRMLALRNLDRTTVAMVMCLMSGVCMASSTIAMVRDGLKDLDAELLDGFAAVLGVPVAVLGTLTGVRPREGSGGLAPEVADVAALIWEVRHLTEAQVVRLAETAEELDGE
ncbi:hypothetical protein AB0M39_37300 [Streptomyces sp. NPDC051907]|uniref:hypothetical protein n=1 Tax=Streptomyces sp. NPDC051907 TaxID=3155284 RepID=UPI0034338FDF